jgi:transcriptional regulator GlxA family with amidase domain
MSNSDLLEWIAEQYEHVEILASVCTGAFLLATAGLLDGRRATTHWRSLDRLREGFPSVEVVDGRRVVIDGKVMTAGGVTSGIDLALAIVARMYGLGVARAAARQMEYEWSGPA